ncbi:MAG: c-type cytochrome [Myxococcales bacterium]|nr:c-type cytochrome [Myxococcales bacterium]
MHAARPTILALAVAVLGGCATELPAGGVARGQVLYQNCTQCHGDDGGGSTLVHAPAIAGLPQWYIEAQVTNFQTGWRGAHADDVEGLKMRPMSRTIKSAADVKLVAEYVAGLPAKRGEATVHGDVAKGQAAYAVCSKCHGVDGTGNEEMKAPPLKQVQDWYVVKQLGKFKAGVRGYEPKDSTAAVMKGISGGIADDAAMRDLAAYIHTLPL